MSTPGINTCDCCRVMWSVNECWFPVTTKGRLVVCVGGFFCQCKRDIWHNADWWMTVDILNPALTPCCTFHLVVSLFTTRLTNRVKLRYNWLNYHDCWTAINISCWTSMALQDGRAFRPSHSHYFHYSHYSQQYAFWSFNEAVNVLHWEITGYPTWPLPHLDV